MESPQGKEGSRGPPMENLLFNFHCFTEILNIGHNIVGLPTTTGCLLVTEVPETSRILMRVTEVPKKSQIHL